MTDPQDDREEVGSWQGDFSDLPAANFFHKSERVSLRGPGPKQSFKMHTGL